jgi:hypothetical protein
MGLLDRFSGPPSRDRFDFIATARPYVPANSDNLSQFGRPEVGHGMGSAARNSDNLS